jgi:hypothetical protein
MKTSSAVVPASSVHWNESLQKWWAHQDLNLEPTDYSNEPESRFHATSVTGIHDLVSLLPQLNVNQWSARLVLNQFG